VLRCAYRDIVDDPLASEQDKGVAVVLAAILAVRERDFPLRAVK
jgi:hypothetical protein